MSNEITQELSHELVEKVMRSIDIPTCPGMVTDAMREAQKDEPDLNRLATLNDCVNISYAQCIVNPIENEKLMELIARVAGPTDNLELLRFIVGNGYAINTPIGYGRLAVIDRTKSYECQRFLIDRGAIISDGYLYEKTIQFIASRNAARLGAFAVLRALRTINRNVASIIARVVWSLRAQTV